MTDLTYEFWWYLKGRKTMINTLLPRTHICKNPFCPSNHPETFHMRRVAVVHSMEEFDFQKEKLKCEVCKFVWTNTTVKRIGKPIPRAHRQFH